MKEQSNIITTYKEMNNEIVKILRLKGGKIELYSAQHIEELQSENKLLKEQLKNSIQLPCVRPFKNGEYGVSYELIEWDEHNGFMSKQYETELKANTALKELNENK